MARARIYPDPSCVKERVRGLHDIHSLHVHHFFGEWDSLCTNSGYHARPLILSLAWEGPGHKARVRVTHKNTAHALPSAHTYVMHGQP